MKILPPAYANSLPDVLSLLPLLQQLSRLLLSPRRFLFSSKGHFAAPKKSVRAVHECTSERPDPLLTPVCGTSRLFCFDC